jgi:hypothetical protein
LIVFRSAGDHWIHRGKSVLKRLLKRDAASRGNPVPPSRKQCRCLTKTLHHAQVSKWTTTGAGKLRQRPIHCSH